MNLSALEMHFAFFSMGKPVVKSTFIFLLISSVCAQQATSSEEKSSRPQLPNGDEIGRTTKFIPTREWQEIPEGLDIPRGLHVRVDMQTGKKEAKLIDDRPRFDVSSALINAETGDNGRGVPVLTDGGITRSQLKSALEKIKTDAGEEATAGDDEAATKNHHFRSYEDIKEEMKNLEQSIKTEYEIVKELVASYLSFEQDSLRLAALGDLEFYVHQYDNALDFVKMGGFNQIVLPALNSTNQDLRSAAAFLLGSACQSNPKAKIAAVESGSLPHLIRLVSFDPSSDVKNRALYAISSIVRDFPLAQKILVQHGGISAFADVFVSDPAGQSKLQLKIITLLSDMISERTLVASLTLNTTDGDAIMLAEKLQQYEAVHVETALVEQGFCHLLPRLLARLRTGLDDSTTEHDVVEKVIQAMLTLSGPCRGDFQHVNSVLLSLEDVYYRLAKEEASDDGESYFTKLQHMSRQLSDILRHDEL